jgi:hypothetical protein
MTLEYPSSEDGVPYENTNNFLTVEAKIERINSLC